MDRETFYNKISTLKNYYIYDRDDDVMSAVSYAFGILKYKDYYVIYENNERGNPYTIEDKIPTKEEAYSKLYYRINYYKEMECDK